MAELLIQIATRLRQQLFCSRYQPLGRGKARFLLRWLADRKYPNSKPDLGHQLATWEQALLLVVSAPYRAGVAAHGHVNPIETAFRTYIDSLIS